MKKTFFMAVFCLAQLTSNAQLVVDSLGKVGIGTETPGNVLHINRRDSSIVGKMPAAVHIFSKLGLSKPAHIGLDSRVKGSAQVSCAVLASADSVYSNAAIGVFGSGSTIGSTGSSAGVYGSTYMPYFGNGTSLFLSYPGHYAGYFNGTVRVTGSTYSNAYLTPSGSRAMYSANVNYLSGSNSGRVTDKLQSLEAIQFEREQIVPQTAKSASASSQEKDQMELSPIQYGLSVEQLKDVFPELVYEDAYGNVSVNYVEMIPLLVQSIKELSAEVAALKGEPRKQAKAVSTGIEADLETSAVSMGQNRPNPFSESTSIELNIPESAGAAMLCIYDLSGKQIKSQDITSRGKTSVTVSSAGLVPGMYIYSLIVDGQVSVTKRMVVTE